MTFSQQLQGLNTIFYVFFKFLIETAYFLGKFEQIWGFRGAKFFPSQK